MLKKRVLKGNHYSVSCNCTQNLPSPSKERNMSYTEYVNNNCALGVFPGGSHQWGSKYTWGHAYPSEIISVLKYIKNRVNFSYFLGSRLPCSVCFWKTWFGNVIITRTLTAISGFMWHICGNIFWPVLRKKIQELRLDLH